MKYIKTIDQTIIYTSNFLKFMFTQPNIILYVDSLKRENIENTIVKLLNIKIDQDSYNIKRPMFSDIKFLNFETIVEAVNKKIKNKDELFFSLDFRYDGLAIIAEYFSLENSVGILINNKLRYQENGKEFLVGLMSNIEEISKNINNINFGQLNNYMYYLSDYISNDSDIRIRQVTSSKRELFKFNKNIKDVDFSEITSVIKKNMSVFLEFLNLIIFSNANISFEFLSYTISKRKDETDPPMLNIKVPLFKSESASIMLGTAGALRVKDDGGIADSSIYGFRHRNYDFVNKILAMNFYLIFKNNKYFSFKNEIEKHILK